MYSIPSNIQLAYAHQEAEHFACWERVFNSITDLMTVIEIAIVLIFLIASIFFPPAIFNIPPTKNTFFAIKFFSPAITIPISLACYPEVIPPSLNAAGTEGKEGAASVHLDCNSATGFEFKEIKNEDSKWGEAFSVRDSDWGFIQPKLILEDSGKTSACDGENCKNLPKLYQADPGPIVGQIMWPWIIGIVIAWLLAAVGDAFTLAAKPMIKLVSFLFALGLIGTVGGLIFSFGVDTKWKENVQNEHPDDAITAHPFGAFVTESSASSFFTNPFGQTESGVSKGSTTFDLGKNTHTYEASITTAGPDRAFLRFNVYDSEPPRLDFREGTEQQSKEVKLEANAHFGFKVNKKTEPLIFLGTQVDDNCDPNPTVEYIGPDFFL